MNERKILLVEDNPNDEELTIHALRKGGVANGIVVVRDGAEALDYLFGQGAFTGRDVGDLPAIVLLDLNLPKLGGIEVLRRLRADQRTRLVPVVILTSSREDRDLISGYTSGANSYVVKPVKFADFQEAVRQVGLYWLMVNERLPAG